MTVGVKERPPLASAADAPDKGQGAAAGGGTLELRVQSIGFLAETIRSIELCSPEGAELPAFTPGAHIDLALPGDLSRSYSLTNCGGRSYVIAVNRDSNSRGGSAYMVEKLRVGDRVRVTPPRNTFPLAERAPVSTFIAGGIGITPFISMIGRLEELGRPWKLHYAVRDRAHAAFLDRLEVLEADQPGRVNLHVDSEAGGVLDVPGILAAQPPEAHLYCCGPTPMIEAFEAGAAGHNEDRVHVERFTGTTEAPSGGFKVVLKRSGQEFDIPAGQSIMQVLMDAGIRVAYSCREGVCGTCETRVIEGVPDHKDNVLSPREQASNRTMMICCSGARSDTLVLDL